MRRLGTLMAVALVASLIGVTAPGSAAPAGAAALTTPALGPNVYIFSPSTPQSQIQATVDSIAAPRDGRPPAW